MDERTEGHDAFWGLIYTCPCFICLFRPLPPVALIVRFGNLDAQFGEILSSPLLQWAFKCTLIHANLAYQIPSLLIVACD